MTNPWQINFSFESDIVTSWKLSSSGIMEHSSDFYVLALTSETFRHQTFVKTFRPDKKTLRGKREYVTITVLPSCYMLRD